MVFGEMYATCTMSGTQLRCLTCKFRQTEIYIRNDNDHNDDETQSRMLYVGGFSCAQPVTVESKRIIHKPLAQYGFCIIVLAHRYVAYEIFYQPPSNPPPPFPHKNSNLQHSRIHVCSGKTFNIYKSMLRKWSS